MSFLFGPVRKSDPARRPPDSVEEHLRSEGFYYDEKAKRNRAMNRPPSKRYDTRSRNRRMAYLDLIILLIMLGVLIPFAQNFLGDKTDYYGLLFDWDYTFTRDRVFLSLIVTAPDTYADPPPEDLLLEAEFTATGGETVILTDILPDPGKDRLLMAEIPLEELPDYVGCTLRLGDKEKVFKTYTGRVSVIPRFRKR